MDRRAFLGTVGAAAAGAAWGASRAPAHGAVVEPAREYLHAYTHRFDLERGFKLHCLLPRLNDDLFGAAEYAGFFTARTGEQPWMFEGDQPPEQTVIPRELRDLHSATFAIRREAPGWQIEQTARFHALYPAVWLSARVRADREDPVTGALMGWTWAERKAPSAWLVDGRAVDRGEGTVLQVPAGGRVLAFRDVHGPFTGVLVFTQPSQRAWVNDDGLFWLWGRAGGAPVELPVVAYALVPAALSPEEVAALADAVSEPPAGVSSGAVAGERPAWAVRVERGRSAPVPPALAPLFADQKAAVSVPSVAGPLLLLPGRECRTELPVPPELERPLPAFDRGVGAGEKALVARHVEEVLAHRAPDSRFTFSEGRTFYDGFVCAALSQVLPLLERPLRGTTAQAVGECLDTLCDHHVRSRAYGLLVPPEQPAFIESAVDYPEITSCLLYGMLAYALNVDRDYPKRWAELLATHVRQIAEMSSLCGVAYAAAEPTRLHVIAESAVGGYLAWASLYHLGRLTSAPWTGEARARAALAWSSYRQLFRWRPEFGETGVVNGWADWCAQVKTPEPWAFVQTCWFSFIPLIPYEHEDRYGLWRSLRAQPWWRYTAGPPPTQRGYDFANALALARAGYPEEVKAHWREVLDRPFSWETFDYTPVLALAAIPQLAALGALP